MDHFKIKGQTALEYLLIVVVAIIVVAAVMVYMNTSSSSTVATAVQQQNRVACMARACTANGDCTSGTAFTDNPCLHFCTTASLGVVCPPASVAVTCQGSQTIGSQTVPGFCQIAGTAIYR